MYCSTVLRKMHCKAVPHLLDKTPNQCRDPIDKKLTSRIWYSQLRWIDANTTRKALVALLRWDAETVKANEYNLVARDWNGLTLIILRVCLLIVLQWQSIRSICKIWHLNWRCCEASHMVSLKGSKMGFWDSKFDTVGLIAYHSVCMIYLDSIGMVYLSALTISPNVFIFVNSSDWQEIQASIVKQNTIVLLSRWMTIFSRASLVGISNNDDIFSSQ